MEGIDYVNFDSIFSFIWGSEFTSGTTGTTCTTISTAVSLLLLKSTCIERDAHNPVLRSSNAETVIKKNQNKNNRTEDQSSEVFFRGTSSACVVCFFFFLCCDSFLNVRHAHEVKINGF